MPSSKHQRTIACLKHRAREAHEAAIDAAFAVIRDKGENQTLWLEAVQALAQADEAQHALDLAQATMPKATVGRQ